MFMIALAVWLKACLDWENIFYFPFSQIIEENVLPCFHFISSFFYIGAGNAENTFFLLSSFPVQSIESRKLSENCGIFVIVF